MKARGLIILVIILVAIAGYYFIIDEQRRSDSAEAERASKKLLPYGPLDIDTVSFINPYGDTIMWERDGEGWLITWPVTDTGEKSTIDMFLGQIAPGQKLEEFEASSDLAQYGLAPPYAIVILGSRRYARTDTLYIGEKTPTSFRAYVSVGSSGKVVVTRDLAHNVMQKRLFHLRDKNFLPPADRRFIGFSLVSGDDRISFQRSGGNWRVSGSAMTVDRDVIEPWISRLGSALVYEFAAENLADTLSFGIGAPHRAAILRKEDGDSIRVSFGEREESLVPVIRTGRDKVMLLESNFLDAFHWTDDRLVVMSLSLVAPGTVAALQWETPDTVASWKLSGDSWMTGGEDSTDVDDVTVKYLLMYLRSTTFETLVTDRDLVKAARPDVIITLGDASGEVLDIISLYRFEDGTLGGISISGGNAGRLSKGTVAEIYRAYSAIIGR